MRPGGQPEPLKGRGEQARGLLAQRAVFGEARGRQGGVAQVLALARVLHCAGREHAGADVRGGFLRSLPAGGKRRVFHRLHRDLQIDAVKQRAGKPLEVLLHGCLGAGAAACPIPAAAAGVHRGD